MHIHATQCFLVDVHTQAGLDHRRSAGKQLAGPLHHDVEVAEHAIDRRQPGGRPQDGRHARHPLHDVELHGPIHGGQIGASDLLEGPHAATCCIEQADEGYPVAMGLLQCPDTFVGNRSIGSTTANGEIPAQHHRLAAVDPDKARDRIGRGEILEVDAIPLRGAGQHAAFPEAARVGQQIDSLADRQLPPALVESDGIGSAHLQRHLGAPTQFVNLRLPRHELTPPVKRQSIREPLAATT